MKMKDAEWRWTRGCFVLAFIAYWIAAIGSGWWLWLGLFANAYVLTLVVIGTRRGHSGMLLAIACVWSLISVLEVSVHLVLGALGGAVREAGSFPVG